MAEENLYKWTDNPTVSGVAICDTDVLNDCLMHLKYDKSGGGLDDKITNCLLEVPQNIKLELNNGTLTLKAGSKVIVPNGVGVFDEVVITEDLSTEFDSNNQKMVFLNPTKSAINHCNVGNQQSSGETSTSTSSYKFWYDTTNNYVKFTNNSGNTWTSGYSLPICLVKKDNGIDQVFNGFGYIGSTVWVDKGVKWLSCNGRNADGTLNNRVCTSTTIKIRQNPIADRLDYFRLAGDGLLVDMNRGRYFEQETMPISTYALWYKPSENIMYYCGGDGVWVKSNNIYLAPATADSTGKITSFNPKEPFRAVDYNEAVLKSSLVETHVITQTYVNGTSGYIVYSNGLCEQWGATTNSGTSSATVTLIKPYKDTNYNVLATKNNINGGNPNNAASWNINTKTVSSFMYSQGDSNGKGCNWRTIGYIA